jgi:nicotinamidase-related amidase
MTAALLIMDVQVGIVARYADDPALLDRYARAISAARAASLPVIYVRVAFREGHPEVSPHNRGFAAIATSGGMTDGDPSTDVHPSIAPQPGDIVVTKKRVSAFAGSDLDVVLRSRGIDTLVLSGISTSGVVLSTLREAADRDFTLVVLSDACADADPEVHRVLTEKLFPRQAEVLTVDEWAKTLARA